MFQETVLFFIVPLIPFVCLYFVIFRLMKNQPVTAFFLIVLICGFAPKSTEQMNETLFEANFTAKTLSAERDDLKFYFGQPHWSDKPSQDLVFRIRFGTPLPAITLDLSKNGEGWQGVLEKNWTLLNIFFGMFLALVLLGIRSFIKKQKKNRTRPEKVES